MCFIQLYSCDADPAALARYVLALLKKDKGLKELQQLMTEQLDVFLGQETAPFLSQLFNIIKSEEYLKGIVDSSSSDVGLIDVAILNNPIIESVITNDNKECTPPLGLEVSVRQFIMNLIFNY